jgi:hypothetical protein
LSSGLTADSEWTAEFSNGNTYVSHIKFLGRNNIYEYSDDLEIFIGDTSCGTTSNSASHAWTTYYCDQPVFSDSITIKRGNVDLRLTLCGVKVY